MKLTYVLLLRFLVSFCSVYTSYRINLNGEKYTSISEEVLDNLIRAHAALSLVRN